VAAVRKTANCDGFDGNLPSSKQVIIAYFFCEYSEENHESHNRNVHFLTGHRSNKSLEHQPCAAFLSELDVTTSLEADEYLISIVKPTRCTSLPNLLYFCIFFGEIYQYRNIKQALLQKIK